MTAYDNALAIGGIGPRRIIEVFITDPDPSVPVESAVLYHAERFATDLTDSEIFMRCDIPALLEKHNAVRTKCRDKRFPESEVYLEPATGKELRYTIRTITAI